MSQLNHIVKFSFLLLLAGCFSGPGLFQQDTDVANIEVAAISGDDGAVTGVFTASASTNQVLAASEGNISGSSINFPPGSLAIDTNVTLEEGASVANSSTASSLGLGNNSVSSLSSSLVVSSSENIDASSPFSLQIPVDGGSSLRLTSNLDTIVVIYKVKKHAEGGKVFVGLIPTKDITITDGKANFEASFFGAYELGYTATEVTESLSVESNTEILTKAEEKKLDNIEWDLGEPELQSDRSVKVPLEVSGFSGALTCSAITSESENDAPFLVETKDLDSDDDIRDHEYIPQRNDAHSVVFRFECADEQGRYETTEWTSSVSVPAAQEEEEEEEEDFNTVYFTGAVASDSPQQRVLDAPSDILTVTGVCESGEGAVNIDVNFSTLGSTPCINGTFTFTISHTSGQGANFDLTSENDGSQELSVHQINDGEWALIYKFPSAPTYVTDQSGLMSVTAAGHYVLTNDVNLSGNWTPLGAFTGILEGDGRSIDGLTIDVTNVQGYWGMFTSIDNGARVAFLNLTDVQITDSVFHDYSSVGSLAGKANCSSSGCEVKDVHIYNNQSNTRVIDIDDDPGNASGGFYGALIGENDSADITSCSVRINMTTSSIRGTGGLIGSNLNGDLEYVHVVGSEIEGETMVGGLVGINSGSAALIKYAGVGDDDQGNNSVVIGNGDTGGLVGRHESNAMINESFAAAEVNSVPSPTGYGYGGLVGYMNGAYIDNSLVEADVNVASGSVGDIGGLVGFLDNNAVIKRSFAAGEISGPGSADCGGLAGKLGNFADIKNAFSVVDVSACGSGTTKGIAGSTAPGSPGTYSEVEYFSSETACAVFAMSGCTKAGAGSDFFDQTYDVFDTGSYTWDTTNVWEFNGSDLPILIWLD